NCRRNRCVLNLEVDLSCCHGRFDYDFDVANLESNPEILPGWLDSVDFVHVHFSVLIRCHYPAAVDGADLAVADGVDLLGAAVADLAADDLARDEIDLEIRCAVGVDYSFRQIPRPNLVKDG